jgi:hypothetical protein
VKRRSVVLLPLLLLLTASPAGAATGDLGHDISYPQCVSGGPATNAPTTGSFGVVGINGGIATYTNPCLQAQLTWADTLAQPPMLYANSGNPGSASTFYWPTAGARDPALCVNPTSNTDPGCAYDYGWHVAADAVAKASALTQGAAFVKGLTWWVDVEIANSWVGNGRTDAADVQGMVDGLRSAGVAEVGVYANGNDWPAVTGDAGLGTSAYTRGTSAAYRTAWAPYFAPKYPIEDGPVWFAGLNDLAGAQARCGTTSLTGGERLLAQYDDPDSAYDGDYRCADRDLTAPTASLTAPTALLVTTGTTKVAWTASDAGGSGLASYDLRRANAPYNGGLGSWAYTRRLLGTSTTVTSPSRGYTSCWYVQSRDAAGNVSALSNRRCVIQPLDDRDLAGSSGWTRTTGATAWYAGSFSTATRLGATLSKTGVRTSRLQVLAYRCPTCGAVTVLLNGTVLKTISLASSATGRAWFALPGFSLRTTTVTLRVASSGKAVRVDALATSGVV